MLANRRFKTPTGISFVHSPYYPYEGSGNICMKPKPPPLVTQLRSVANLRGPASRMSSSPSLRRRTANLADGTEVPKDVVRRKEAEAVDNKNGVDR